MLRIGEGLEKGVVCLPGGPEIVTGQGVRLLALITELVLLVGFVIGAHGVSVVRKTLFEDQMCQVEHAGLNGGRIEALFVGQQGPVFLDRPLSIPVF